MIYNIRMPNFPVNQALPYVRRSDGGAPAREVRPPSDVLDIAEGSEYGGPTVEPYTSGKLLNAPGGSFPGP